MRPRIGITLTLDAQLRAGRDTWFCDAAYATAVEAAGGRALLLAASDEPEETLAQIDGLVIPGGGDFLPSAPYPSSVAFRAVEARQIPRDLALARAALARGLPFLGICYGMQLLALACGGALVYDIGHDRPGAAEHRLPASGRHRLALAPGSRLARSFGGAAEIAVNSRHHQGVAAPGRQLVATAHASDGLIEAIEAAPDAPFSLGVQWHPEDMEREHALRVYGALVAAASAYAAACDRR